MLCLERADIHSSLVSPPPPPDNVRDTKWSDTGAIKRGLDERRHHSRVGAVDMQRLEFQRVEMMEGLVVS
jgi:hypothetical protein